MEKAGGWFGQTETENCPRVKFCVKIKGSFLKFFFFFRCFSLIFAIANQLLSFLISRLANLEEFFNVNIYFKCKNKNVDINDYSFKYIGVVCYFKLRFFASLVLQYQIWNNSADWLHRTVLRAFNSWNRNAVWVSK